MESWTKDFLSSKKEKRINLLRLKNPVKCRIKNNGRTQLIAYYATRLVNACNNHVVCGIFRAITFI
jgi:hypothetical protein